MVERANGLEVKCDPTPLDGPKVIEHLVAGRKVWTTRFDHGVPTRFVPAQPGDVAVVQHRCTVAEALIAPLKPSQKTPGPSTPAGPGKAPVAPSSPFSGSPTGTDPVPGAEPQGFKIDWDKVGTGRYEECHNCKRLIHMDGPELYVSAELGTKVVWIVHNEC